MAELIADSRFDRFFTDLIATLGEPQVNAFLDSGPPTSLPFHQSDEALILPHIGPSNWLLARKFGLELARYGYPRLPTS